MDTIRNSASFSNSYDSLMGTQTASDANHIRKNTTCDRVDSSDGRLSLISYTSLGRIGVFHCCPAVLAVTYFHREALA